MQDCEEKNENKINDFVEMPSYWSAVGSSYSMHQHAELPQLPKSRFENHNWNRGGQVNYSDGLCPPN